MQGVNLFCVYVMQRQVVMGGYEVDNTTEERVTEKKIQ